MKLKAKDMVEDYQLERAKLLLLNCPQDSFLRHQVNKKLELFDCLIDLWESLDFAFNTPHDSMEIYGTNFYDDSEINMPDEEEEL